MAKFSKRRLSQFPDAVCDDENASHSEWNRIGTSVPGTWPDVRSEIREIKRLAEDAKPPRLAFGTELLRSVPSSRTAVRADLLVLDYVGNKYFNWSYIPFWDKC